MRHLLFLFLFSISLYSSTSFNIISNVLVSLDSKNYIDISAANDDTLDEKFYLKIVLNKNVIKDEKYYLRLMHSFKSIKEVNVESIRKDNELIIELSKDTKKEIIIKIDNNVSSDSIFLELELYDVDEYRFIQEYEKMFFGFAYGIIFCAFIYNFILYIFNKEITFLYYSLLQITLLFLLLLNNITFDFLKSLYEYIPLVDIIGQLAFIFAILFNRSFLDLKKYIPIFDKALLGILYIYILDLIYLLFTNESIIEEYVPASFLLFLLVLSALFVYKKGSKVAIFYILGWTSLLLCVAILELDFFNYTNSYALHFAIPLESLILSFSLGFKVKELENEKKSQQEMLIHQNKLASMGEMINNIAHQYRQPLTHLGYIFMNIKSAYEYNQLDKEYLNNKLLQGNNQLEFMSNTIDNFRQFYELKKEKDLFFLSDSINSAIEIISPILKEKDISLISNIDNSFEIYAYSNEYSQVVLNLLVNAKDALLEHKIQNAKIEITLKEKNKSYILEIKDNAKGISVDIVEKIFEPYFSTKIKSSGIGLYMSKMIIHDHFFGQLYLINSDTGATFAIKIPKNI